MQMMSNNKKQKKKARGKKKQNKQRKTNVGVNDHQENSQSAVEGIGEGELNSPTPTTSGSSNSGSNGSLDNEETKLFEGVPYHRYVVDILESGDYLMQNHYKKVPDPTFDVCDVQVKIGDLGNACWVVSVH